MNLILVAGVIHSTNATTRLDNHNNAELYNQTSVNHTYRSMPNLGDSGGIVYTLVGSIRFTAGIVVARDLFQLLHLGIWGSCISI